LGESSGGDHVERLAVVGIVPCHFGPPLIDRDPAGELQLGHRPPQEGGALAHRLDEHTLEIGPPKEYRQRRKAPTASEISETPSFDREHVQEPLGVIDLLAQRARTEESHGPGPFQDGNESLVTVRSHDSLSS
jgi:hypothetical protein